MCWGYSDAVIWVVSNRRYTVRALANFVPFAGTAGYRVIQPTFPRFPGRRQQVDRWANDAECRIP